MRGPVIAVAVCLVLAGVLAWLAATEGPTMTVERGLRSLGVRPPEPPAKLLFVGDIMLSRSVGDVMARKGDWLWPFRLTASVTAGADLAFANLETTVSSRGREHGCGYCFRADPRVMRGLEYAGFDVVSVANNHVWDYGPEAWADTLANLSAAGIAAAGAGREPVFRTVGGTTVAYLAFTDLLPASACASGVNCYDADRMNDDVARARGAADIVVVSFHAGEEYVPANAHQRNLYRAAVDAGADIVVGHHPHVVQETERYGDGFIAYSLGNFIFDQNWSDETRRGMALEVVVDDGRIADIATRSVSISREYQPVLK